MTQPNETPAGKAGVRRDLLGRQSHGTTKPTAPRLQFSDHRQAALALLNGDYRLTRMAGRFLGQLAVDSTPLSDAQAEWLDRLLVKHRLAPLTRGPGQ